MNSINKNQPEDTQKDLRGDDAAKKIKELTDKAKTCFFCTTVKDAQFATRPMAVQEVDDNGTYWFLSASDSHTNEQINQDNKVRLLFQGSAHSDFLSIEGTATISTDKEKIKKLWEPILKTWFTEGIDDPRITVISVKPYNGYYWDTKHGNFVAFAKQLVGAALGKTLDDSVEGTLKP